MDFIVRDIYQKLQAFSEQHCDVVFVNDHTLLTVCFCTLSTVCYRTVRLIFCCAVLCCAVLCFSDSKIREDRFAAKLASK